MPDMLFKIIEPFGPSAGAAWDQYVQWRKFHFTAFDSIDGMLRPSLFVPETAEDWENCINADYRTDLITSLDYAKTLLTKYEKADLIGVQPDINAESRLAEHLLGFDIIDGYSDVSLLTNWGAEDIDVINRQLQPNGLIGDAESALELRDYLQNHYPNDSHAACCSVWAIYRV
ncbi:MAG: hypothetical protein Tsb002_15530 [Wenzhouxiangellaceae bacterium]